MEYKRIEDLSIKECLDRLQISSAMAKSIVAATSSLDTVSQNLLANQRGDFSEIADLVIGRLTELLLKDKKQFSSCKSKPDYQQYISTWEDGLWMKEAEAAIKRIDDAEKERRFFETNKSTIAGLKKYLSTYPRGRYADNARQLLTSKQKNKKITTYSIAAVALAVIAILCWTNYHSVSYLNSLENASFGKRGGNVTRTISTDAIVGNIHLVESEDWITTDKNGKDVKIVVAPNHVGERKGTIKVYAYTTLFGFNLSRKEISMNINQSSGIASNLSVTTSNIHFKKFSSESTTVYATTDGMNLKVTTEGVDGNWVDVSHEISEDGEDSQAKIVISSHNNEGGEKHGVILVSSDSFERRINISQESGLATYFNVSTNSLTMAEEGTDENQHYPVTVKTDGTTWSVKDKPDWLNAEVRLQSGILSVTLGRNPGKIRTGTIALLSNNGELQEINVKQWGDPTNLSTARSSVRFSSSSDYDYVSISNDSQKSLSTSVSSGDGGWLSASVRNKTEIRISCSTNNNSPRNGTVYVDCGGERTSITVKQDGWESCSRCDGSGHVRCTSCNNGYTSCTNYNYTGVVDNLGQYGHGKWVTQYTYIGGMPFPQNRLEICPTCGGSYKVKCSYCGGDGQRICSKCDGKGKTKKSY